MTKAEREEIRNNLTNITAMMTNDLGNLRRELIRNMRALAADLSRVAGRIESEPEAQTIVNSLGEVQGRGAGIDVLCGKYAQLHAIRESVGWAIGEATK